MKPALIAAHKPVEVARDVAALVAQGHRSFVISSIDDGGMLDLERLGAARYAAGLYSRVVLDEAIPLAAAVR